MRKKDIWILVGALCAAALLVFSQFFQESIPTGSWGLSFRVEGQTPIGPAAADTLARHSAAYVGDSTEKVLYLTFDAGYENGNVSRVLDVLKSEQVPGAFFILAHLLEANTDLVQRMVDEGHLVCNHTAKHKDMTKLSESEIEGVLTVTLKDVVLPLYVTVT